ncbi:SDR family NAD(P)-dependent oxidoreductase [uncultured Cyclobacterium sp.]|uniref:SDR family NAD(P)-dependent oxidoreductase n=1 Tax=uncultured Cyclobacterium sp. TaxID=453820 RepID=UPI0030ED9A27
METKKDNGQLGKDQIEQCIAILEILNNDTDQIFNILLDRRIELITQAGRLSRPQKEELIKRKKNAKKKVKKERAFQDKFARNQTGIRSARESHVFVAPKMVTYEGKEKRSNSASITPRECHVCKEVFTSLHHFYDTMCTACGDFNYAKRFQTADLTGQVALVTGARLKIGYHICLMILRAGATVIATTRFPVDAALRFSKEDDFLTWDSRLKIHGLDLRHIPSVELFCNFITSQYIRLDVLINNAAQTVRRPAGFYKHLLSNEETDHTNLPSLINNLLSDHQVCLQELGALSATIEDSNRNLPVTWHGSQLGIGLSSSEKIISDSLYNRSCLGA